ncbi:MAG TPA: hypothetical protein DEF00_02725 [Candidatus Taylorbacteria bacterium]|nr:MAG: hypothetical protein UY29_C0009G0021 [Parcubacteria group bacterium GW2011_GWC2_48_17]HBV01284.1 hypothetical protein [Candidatus Taylorbacteria bacterium]
MNISRIKPALVLFVLVALLVCPSARNALAEKAIPDGFRFERTLRVGSQGDDARYLQILLNRDNETRVNAPGLIGGAGAETGYFGLATKNAVGKFQFKYASEVLAPAGLSKSTGIVGPLTRNKLNWLSANASLTPDVSIASPPLPAQQEATPLTVMATLAPSDLAPPPSFDEVNRKTREALVNVICTTKRGGSFNLISGSGVIIDPRGIILTNAHLGQYFLLQDFPTPGNIECIIRAGEPARNMYKATLLFIPPAWVRDNAAKIDADEPTGTGENDYALLLINDTTIEENPLPEIFQYIQMDFGDVSFREPAVVLIAAYPVGFLSGITVQKDLYPSSSVVVTGAVYSFKENTPDVFSLGGSVVAQKGSSGGAVVNRENKLIGLIVTSSTGKTTGERDLNALTMSHIDSSFREATGDSIRSLFVGDIRASAQSFNEKIAPELKKILQDALTKR